MNPQLTEHFQNRREDQSVAFQFDNHQILHVAFAAILYIVESEGGIDGEAFCLRFVYQRDT